MIEVVIPDLNDDNRNPREYELLADDTYRMTMDIVDSWFCCSMDYKGKRVSEMLGFEKQDDGCYGVAVYESRPRLVIPSEYKGVAVTAVVQPHYPEDFRVEGVTEIVLPDSIRRIGSECFSYYYDLTRIEIPKGVTEIGRFAFGDCSALREVILPDGLKSIETGAFSKCKSLSHIDLPESLESVGEQAFAYCETLKSIRIPKGVSNIGEGAFLSCDSLSNITVEEGNTAYRSVDGDLYSADGRALIKYAQAKPDREFTLPSCVVEIAEDAFYGAKSLERVNLPMGLVKINDYAFSCCDALSEVEIPQTVTEIGYMAFSESVKLIKA